MERLSTECGACRCGARTDAAIENIDDATGATWIECGECGRVCGGVDPEDARAMWNAAMAGAS